jgi:two-component system nitrogen regulation response regulator GlnG
MRAMADDFLAALRQRPWPGNLRELKHAVEYAAVVSRGATLRAEHLPPPPSTAAATPAAAPADADARLVAAVEEWVARSLGAEPSSVTGLHGRLMELVEPALFARVLAAAEGNRTAAARILGLDRATLRGKLAR